MSEFTFIGDLCESRLIPSRSLLKQWKDSKLAELCYLYFIGLCILLANRATKKWAQDYCDATGEPNDFRTWRTSGNDLYAMLYALSSDDSAITLSPSIIRHWLRHVIDDANTHRFLLRIDGMFHISNSAMKSLRRSVTNWDEVDPTERHDLVVKLIKLIHDRAPSNSELLPQLKKLATEIDESATAGATGAANVATVTGGLGAGFDPDDDWRSIYPKKKPVVLRRSPP